MRISTQNRGQETVMYRNGSVYSPADPFATAVLVQGDRVVWVGEEAGADSLTDNKVTTVDLDGLVLVPGFVARGGGDAPAEDETRALVSAGYTACIVGEGDEKPAFHSFAEDFGHDLPAGVEVRRASDTKFSHSEAGLLVEASLEDRGWIDVIREELRAGTAVGLVPAEKSTQEDPIINPWAWATQGLRLLSDETGLPTRATFTAQTRGLRRLFRVGGPLGGQIVPDANADFVGWRAEALMVQTADSRIAAWSTDPRARTPLLPELAGEKYPQAEIARIGTLEYGL
ncbi:hypothetical protein [Rothia uropygioeca]|uniref:hypothetical protein n=1 Tax=Kocuria sp. 257 TaxID=2021970 RepID=UPI00101368EC|nr:hypothetical protein [Kocuria sp. 257]